MSFGQIVRIIECFVTIYCGIILAVRPCPMRWDNRISKCIFIIALLPGILIEVFYTFYFKFSVVGTIVIASYFFIILLVFYRIYFWKLFAQNFIYWYTIVLIKYLVIYICCYMKSIRFMEYIENSYGIGWHWLHILSMIGTMGFALWLINISKKREIIICKNKRGYIGLSLVVICEELIDRLLFNPNIAVINVRNINIFLMVLVFWSAFSLILIVTISRAYMDTLHQERISQLNLNMLQKQYELFQEIYAEKRRQIHDSVQIDIILLGFLKDGKNSQAINYLEEKLNQYSFKQKNRYTGIDAIDLMLTYKVNEASLYGINVQLDVDVFFCPICETDMCIVLGNLIDNAIDATKDLKEDQRWVQIKMRNPNSIFILEISNPYEGKRKKIDGQYITTKPDKTRHGLGLDSVTKIVSKAEGMMKIDDKESVFLVVVTLFGKRRLEDKER